MQFSGQSNDLLHTVDLEALSQARSDQGPVFSLYLDLRSKRGAAQDLPGSFDQLVQQVETQKKLDQEPAEYQKQWRQEADRLRRWLKTEQPQGQGLAVFSGQAAGLWQAYLLPAPVLDRLIASERPYVRPLEVLLGEFKCTLVVLIDAGGARLVEFFLGRAEEISNLQAVPVTGDALESGLRQHARAVLDQVEAVWQERSCDRLVIGGSDEALNELRDELPEPLLMRLAGEIHLSPQAEMEDILAQVQVIESEYEENLEEQRVDELLTRAGNSEAAVLGLDQTLLAVQRRKVRLLVVEKDYHQEGGECPNCGFLGEWEQGVCLLCGMALRPEPDIIEVALKRVLDQGGEIEVLRTREACRALAQHQRIGALLYDPTAKPTERESANQMPIAKEGKIHPEGVHDETVQESFPASDPPGGW